MAPEVRSLITDNKEKLRIQTEEKLKKAKEEATELSQAWEQRKKEIEENVKRRPLLMQEPQGIVESNVEEEDAEDNNDGDKPKGFDAVLQEAGFSHEEQEDQEEEEESQNQQEQEQVQEEATNS